MRTYKLEATRWDDGHVTVSAYNVLGDWEAVANAAPGVTDPGDVLARELEAQGFENLTWSEGLPVTATRDEHRDVREIFGDDHMPAVDENTDHDLLLAAQAEDDATPYEPAPRQVAEHYAKQELERSLNAQLPADSQVRFMRYGDLITGWGAVPAQIFGFIGPEAGDTLVSTADTHCFYLRIRSNTATLTTYTERGVPRGHETSAADVLEVATVHPVVAGDDYASELPDGAQGEALILELIRKLSKPDPFTNPTGVQRLGSWILASKIARAFHDAGLPAATEVARSYLEHEDLAAYAQQWLDLPEEEKLEGLQPQG